MTPAAAPGPDAMRPIPAVPSMRGGAAAAPEAAR